MDSANVYIYPMVAIAISALAAVIGVLVSTKIRLSFFYNKKYEDLIDQCLVKVIDGDSRVSTGFFVSEDRHILTCYHVLNPGNLTENFGIEHRGKKYSAKVCQEFCNPDKDIAVLKVNSIDRFIIPPLSIEFCQPGAPVVAKGYQEQNLFGRAVSIYGKIDPNHPIQR